MIKTIVFDLGGVLFSEGKSVAIKNLTEKHNYNKDVVLNLLMSPKSLKLRRGLLSDSEFWGWGQSILPEGYDANLIKEEWYNSYLLDEELFNLIKRIKKSEKYKLVIFSGNIESRVEFLDQKYDFRKYFDTEVYSFDYHLNKPNKKFVEDMLNAVNSEPGEIVYIDDARECILPAQELGINTIIYSRGKTKDLERKLQEFGVEY